MWHEVLGFVVEYSRGSRAWGYWYALPSNCQLGRGTEVEVDVMLCARAFNLKKRFGVQHRILFQSLFRQRTVLFYVTKLLVVELH